MIDGFLQVLAGLFFLLLGFGKVPVRTTGLGNAEFISNKGKFFRIGGVAIALLGVAQIIIAAFR